jgi:hypothetical protein
MSCFVKMKICFLQTEELLFLLHRKEVFFATGSLKQGDDQSGEKEED